VTEAREPLDIVAGLIEAHWRSSDNHRISTALLLKQAQLRVEAGEDPRFNSFKAWCEEMLPCRSWRDIRRLLAIANAADPQAALEEHRRKTREQTRRWRARSDSRESGSAERHEPAAKDDETEDILHNITVEGDSDDPGAEYFSQYSDDPIYQRVRSWVRRQRRRPYESRMRMMAELHEDADIPWSAAQEAA